MADTATLQTWLSEAEIARHTIATTGGVVMVKHAGNREVQYSRVSLDQLDAYIASLRSQLAAAEGEPTMQRRPIYATF